MDASLEGVGMSPATSLPTFYRNCSVCEELIPVKRLIAIPTATKCVVCTEANGDVPVYRRYDEYQNEDLVSTYFTSNSAIEAQLHRLNALNLIPNKAYQEAVGDDSHIGRERVTEPISGYDLSYAFEADTVTSMPTSVRPAPPYKRRYVKAA